MADSSDVLKGKRVLVTRPREQASDFSERLTSLGMVPILFPTIDIVPMPNTTALDDAIRHLASFDWVIFTSVNGVESFFKRFNTFRSGEASMLSEQVVAIGPSTASTLHKYGVEPYGTPDEYIADRIPDLLGDVNDKNVLLPRAEIVREALAKELLRRGAHVTEVAAYQTVAAQPTSNAWMELHRGVDVLSFTSSSTVRFFLQLVRQDTQVRLGEALVACIGPITAQTAREQGLHVDVIARQFTAEGLVQVICELLIKQVDERGKVHG